MNKSLFFLFVFLVISLDVLAQAGKVTGIVKDKANMGALPAVTIRLQGTNLQTSTLADGTFVFDNIFPGDRFILITKSNYNEKIITITVKAGETTDLGEILLETNIPSSEITESVSTVSESELAEEGDAENISGVLHGSRDVFASTAGYTLGPMRFRIRGYVGENFDVSINGVPMDDPESENVYWSNWGGLNDVMRNSEQTHGLAPLSYGYGNIGGSTNLITRASNYSKGIRVTYSSSNRSYRNRLMVTGSTGLMPNGWAFTVSGSRRWSDEGFVEGTFYNAWSYFFGAEKKINNHHSIALTAFGAPTKYGKQAPSTQEVYDITGDNYYNPNWGWYNGEKKNAKVADYHRPVFVLNHFFNINKTTKLTTSVGYTFGKNGSSSLNWGNAADPRPDYYRYLPSYMTNDYSRALTLQALKNDVFTRQINWYKLHEINSNYNYTVNNANGVAGNTVSGRRALYTIESWRNDLKTLTANTVFKKDINDHIAITAGAQYRNYTGMHFKTLDDLLGADYWLDVDKYAERDIPDPTASQNDLNIPNHVIREGDKYGYDYDSHINEIKGWAQSEFTYRKFDFYLAGEYSSTTYWRTGNMKNGRFPNNSYGDSKKTSFSDFAVKGGATYKINGRNYIVLNGTYLTRPPAYADIYISPRTHDGLQDNIYSEKIISGDLGYIARFTGLKLSANVYYTSITDQLEIKSFYHDGYANFVNYVMSGIDELHLGAELGLEAKLTNTVSLTAIAAYGQFTYQSNPKVKIYVDNSAQVVMNNQTVYADGLMIDGTPQMAVSVGLKYEAPKFWFAGFNVNYVDNIYIAYNPARRTDEAVAGIPATDPRRDYILNQEKLPSAFTADLFIGKSWRIKYKYYLAINLNVSNILNTTDFRTGGFEQLRYDIESKNPDKFPTKYFYYYGRTYFLNMNFRF